MSKVIRAKSAIKGALRGKDMRARYNLLRDTERMLEKPHPYGIDLQQKMKTMGFNIPENIILDSKEVSK